MPRLCVISGTEQRKYFEKGEIKERYYNPCNFFDEIHIITLSDSDIEENKVQKVAGQVKLAIYPVGKSIDLFFINRKKVLEKVMQIKPDVIRAHTPNIDGWFAAYCGRKLNIPVVISLHGDPDRDSRYQKWKNRHYFRLIISLFSRLFFEPFAIRNANKIICAYLFPAAYAKKFGAKDIEVIYNRVDTSRFKKNEGIAKSQLGRLTIICVGRLIKEKNQECLIKAIVGLDITLLLIGDGPQYGYLKRLAKSLNVEDNVRIIRSVPHSEIHKYYASADIFAIAIKYGGIAIPVIEAISSSLPIVVPKPRWEKEPELVGDIAIVVENTPESFREAFERLISNPELREELGEIGRKRSLEIDGKKMEEKEMKVYEKLISESRNH